MNKNHPLAAQMKGVPVDSENLYSTKQTGFFEYLWSANNAKKHFKKIKKRVIFTNKLEVAPSEVILKNVVYTNSGDLEISNLTKKGFTIEVRGVVAVENAIQFEYETIINDEA